MAYGWEGEKVRLVPLDKAKHLENALLWVNDPEITAWTLIGDAPMTRLGEEQFFDQAMRSGEAPLFAVETLAGEHIGFSGLHRIEWPAGVGITGTLLGRRDLGAGATAATPPASAPATASRSSACACSSPRSWPTTSAPSACSRKPATARPAASPAASGSGGRTGTW